MSETECRHLPRPVWNPIRCKLCDAKIDEPVASERLIRAAKEAMGFIPDRRDHAAAKAELRDAIADAERGGLTWSTERPTVPGWYRMRDKKYEWFANLAELPRDFDAFKRDGYRLYCAGPILEPAEPAAEGGEA